MRITGTFVDFGVEFGQPTPRYPEIALDAGFWDREVADLRAAGMTDLIVARVMELGRTHYHSALFQEWEAADHIARIMTAAASHGMKVWLGGHLNAAFWDRGWDFDRMMRRDLTLNLAIFRELHDRYAAHTALAGWYISNEPDRDNLDTAPRLDALRNCLNGIYAGIRKMSDLPVLVSPFYSKSVSPAELADWWDTLLDRPMFDIVAMQDGVGCFPRRDLRVEDVPRYYAPLATVFRAHGIRFWNNVESFATPWPSLGPLERIGRQYEAGCSFVERSITWEFGRFLGRQQASQERYEQFVQWNCQPLTCR